MEDGMNTDKRKRLTERFLFHLRVDILPTLGLLAAMALAMAWVKG
jgi:hypothetical protein